VCAVGVSRVMELWLLGVCVVCGCERVCVFVCVFVFVAIVCVCVCVCVCVYGGVATMRQGLVTTRQQGSAARVCY
jgi:hypothetical protein